MKRDDELPTQEEIAKRCRREKIAAAQKYRRILQRNAKKAVPEKPADGPVIEDVDSGIAWDWIFGTV